MLSAHPRAHLNFPTFIPSNSRQHFPSSVQKNNNNNSASLSASTPLASSVILPFLRTHPSQFNNNNQQLQIACLQYHANSFSFRLKSCEDYSVFNLIEV
ncbi:hypothetical protein RYX36_033215 [Vicia faba]